MVRKEVISQSIALCVASLLVMTTAMGDVTLMHPVRAGGLLLHDFDTPDTTYISASPFGGLVSTDVSDNVFIGGGLGSGYASPLLNSGLNVLPPYNIPGRRLGYPVSRRYGRSRRMRLVPV